MNEDNLRDRLRRLDPIPDEVPVEPLTTPSSRARLENIMNTPLTTDTTSERPTANYRRGRWLVAAAAAAVIVAGVGVAIANSGGDDAAEVAGPALELSLGSDDAMASCLALDPVVLAQMAPAFAATATAVDGETVILTVERWYAGGDAATVELHAQPGMEALIAGFDFEVGQQYLITATDGNVNFCGYSGPATPELTAVFDQAFPG